MVDVAVCWNYLVVADTQHVTKYGLVNNKPGLGKQHREWAALHRFRWKIML